MKTCFVLDKMLVLIPFFAILGGCASDSTPVPSQPVKPGDSGGGGTAGQPGASCTSTRPVDVPGTSLVLRNVAGLAARDALISTRTKYQTGAYFTVTLNSSGQPTRVAYVPPGSSDDYTDFFYYDSGGRLSHWQRATSSSASNVDEYFYYDSAGLLVRWEMASQGKTSNLTFAYAC